MTPTDKPCLEGCYGGTDHDEQRTYVVHATGCANAPKEPAACCEECKQFHRHFRTDCCKCRTSFGPTDIPEAPVPTPEPPKPGANRRCECTPGECDCPSPLLEPEAESVDFESAVRLRIAEARVSLLEDLLVSALRWEHGPIGESKDNAAMAECGDNGWNCCSRKPWHSEARAILAARSAKGGANG